MLLLTSHSHAGRWAVKCEETQECVRVQPQNLQHLSERPMETTDDKDTFERKPTCTNESPFVFDTALVRLITRCNPSTSISTGKSSIKDHICPRIGCDKIARKGCPCGTVWYCSRDCQQAVMYSTKDLKNTHNRRPPSWSSIQE